MNNPYSESKEILYFYLKDRWTDGDIVIENQIYKPVADEDHIRIFVNFGESEPRFLGNTAPVRYIGDIVLQIYTALGTGFAQGNYLTDKALDVFSKQIINEIICGASYPITIGETFGFYQINVHTPFYFDS